MLSAYGKLCRLHHWPQPVSWSHCTCFLKSGLERQVDEICPEKCMVILVVIRPRARPQV